MKDFIYSKRFLIAGVLVFILFILITFTLCPAQPSEQWTVKTLKEYFDESNKLRDSRIEQKFESLQLAITKQEDAYNERFDNTNEWRNSYDDLISVYLTRKEFEALEAKVNDIKIEMDRIRNMKAGGNVVWAYLLAGVSLIIAIISFTRNYRIKI